jgi:hypothetical protein
MIEYIRGKIKGVGRVPVERIRGKVRGESKGGSEDNDKMDKGKD